MSQAEVELSEVKSIIRGLLISSSTETTIRQLEIDYRKHDGASLPFKSLGYPSAEAFLRSIPDTVHLREPSRGCPVNLLIVEPVQSKKSEHVEKMVIRQKSSKSVRGMKRTSAVIQPKIRSSDNSRLNGMAPRFIPSALRLSMARVWQRYAPKGLPLSSLGNELSLDLSMAGWAQNGKTGWLNTYGFCSIQEVIDGLRDQGLIKIMNRGGKEWVVCNLDNDLDRHRTSDEIRDRKNRGSPSGDMVPAGAERLTDDEWSDEDAGVLVSDRMKKNFRDILAKYPDGLWCADLPLEYKIHTGAELDVKQIGFISIVQMASKLKDVFICTRPDSNSDWILFDSNSNALWNSPAAPVGKGNQLPSLPSKLTRNVELLLEDYPGGIERAKFLDLYKAKYQEDFPFADYGFSNLMEVLGHLSKRGTVHLKFSGTIPMVCMPCRYSTKTQEDEFDGLKKDGDFISALYPMGVVGYKEVIPLQELPEGLAPGCSFDLQVTEVTSPSKFWYQIFGTELRDQFEEMMDCMQDFYNSNGPTVYRIPSAAIMIGQYCAAKFPPDPDPLSEWHRGIITALPSLSHAEVYYVDYGSKAKIPKSEIYFLDVRFAKLPMQALPARLTNIRPPGYGLWRKLRRSPVSDGMTKPEWTNECMNFFVGLISNRPTVASVTRIKKSNSCLSVGLTDTTGEDDVHINDQIVSAGLAEFGEMTDDEEDTPVLGPLKRVSERRLSGREHEYSSPPKTPLPHVSPGGTSSVVPSQRPVMSENGYQYMDNAASPSKSPYAPEMCAYDEYYENGGYDESKDVGEYLRQQSLISEHNNEVNLSSEQCVKDQKRLEELRKLEEVMKIEREKSDKDKERRIEEIRKILEMNKLKEAQRVEAERRLEEARKLEEARRLEEQYSEEARQLEEARRREEAIRLEEARRLEEQRKLELQRQIEEQRRREELRMLEEQRKLEEKLKQESQLRFELQKLQMQQKLLELQQQQYQAQLLLLGSQNNVGGMIPPGINSLLAEQPLLQMPPPLGITPPGMMNGMPLANMQPDISQLLANALQCNSLSPGAMCQNLTAPGNLFPNQNYMQWSNAGGNIRPPNFPRFGGAGDNLGPKPKVFVPPGFENFPRPPPVSASQIVGPSLNYNPPAVAISGIGDSARKPDFPPVALKDPLNASAICSTNALPGAADSCGLQKTQGIGSIKVESPDTPVNISKSDYSQISSKQKVVEPVNIQASEIAKNVAAVDKYAKASKVVTSSHLSQESSSVPRVVPASENKALDSKSTSETKPKGKTLTKSAISELSALLRSYHLKAVDDKGPVKENSVKACVQKEEKVGCDAQEKWRVKIDTNSADEEDPNFLKGCLGGQEVNVIKVNGSTCVLTEEILSLFFKNLPVHVALKIAELRPNGDKIKSISLNPYKERNLCRKISHLKVVEVNPRGSDVHLVTVETLHYLCAALESPA